MAPLQAVYNVEKSYVDRPKTSRFQLFLFIASHEFLIHQKYFTGPFIDFSQYLITLFLIVVRQEVSNLDSLVVVHELELAINRDLYGCLYSLGSQ